MGGSIYQAISRIIYIDPQAYAKLSVSDKHETARLTGKLNRQIGNRDKMPTILWAPAAGEQRHRPWGFLSLFRKSTT